MNKYRDMVICAAFLVIGIAIGYFLPRRPEPDIVIDNQDIIDSLRQDILIQKAEIEAIEAQKNDITTIIRYKTKTLKNEAQKYMEMDSSGRVSHFREWVRDSTAAAGD